MEQSTDLRSVVLGICDLARRLLEAPAALFLSRDLPIPGAIARGPGALILAPEEGPGDRSTLPRAWAPWIDELHRGPPHILSLPDFRLLPPARRPRPTGAALLAPCIGEEPAWRASLVLPAGAAYWFTDQRLARLRRLLPYLRSQLVYAAQLRGVVSFDYLTQIYNRAFFIDHLERMLDGARRTGQRFGLLIIDIDDFRSFNSRYGYDAGDAVLRAVAAALEGVLRSTDVLARYGGEEFVAVLAPELTRGEARGIGERLRGAIAALRIPVPHLGGGSREVHVTVSIGGALFPDDGPGRDGLFQAANRRLLAAKRGGKNRVLFRLADGEAPPAEGAGTADG
ncbi:MAG: diguanylate cyclase [Candidatus Eisenbacteria bacterium]|nr:diguanylate cyclase [Candidatus Eisenbacteria bacterium]